MKTILSILLCLLFAHGSYADDKYESAMKKNLAKIGECKTADDYVKVANGFERIALAEKDKWLPYYYGSLVNVLASFNDSSAARKDSYLDKADLLVSSADSLEPDNSEIYTLKGMLAQARMQVDPMNRWQTYGNAATENFNKSMELDPTNPRPEYLMGVGIYYTPKQFGGGAENAKPILEKSMEKFNNFIPANELMPSWGKEQLEQILNQIEGK